MNLIEFDKLEKMSDDSKRVWMGWEL